VKDLLSCFLIMMPNVRLNMRVKEGFRRRKSSINRMTTVKRARAVMEVWWGRMRIPKGITKAVRWKLFRFSSELKLSLSPGLVNLT